MMKVYLVPILVVFALSASACGPVRSTVGLIRADKALVEAREMNAIEHAPYVMTLAESLRNKAWEEQGYAHYDISMNMANEAEKLAREAMQVTRDIVAPLPPPAEESDLFGGDDLPSADTAPSSEDEAAPVSAEPSGAEGSEVAGDKGDQS